MIQSASNRTVRLLLMLSSVHWRILLRQLLIAFVFGGLMDTGNSVARQNVHWTFKLCRWVNEGHFRQIYRTCCVRHSTACSLSIFCNLQWQPHLYRVVQKEK